MEFTLRDGARELAVPARFGDLARLIDSHDRTIDDFPICFAFVILFHAEGPFEGSAPEGISRTNPVAGPVTAVARIEVDGTGWFEFSLHEYPPKTNTGSILRCDQEVVFTDHPQTGQMGRILKISSSELDLVR